MVSEEYIEFLVHVANQKMEENIRRIDRFVRIHQFCSWHLIFLQYQLVTTFLPLHVLIAF